MIHVVDFEKTAFSTPFRGVLAPSGQQINTESGRGHPLSGTRETWLAPNVHVATILPHASRLTLHDARTSGVRSCADPPPLANCLTPTAVFPMNSGPCAVCPSTFVSDRQFKDRRGAGHRRVCCQRPSGARSRRAAPLFQYVTETGRTTGVGSVFNENRTDTNNLGCRR
jgi:hypothetical protein